MSGGEPSSIKRSARATQSACTPCDRGKIFYSADGTKNSEVRFRGKRVMLLCSEAVLMTVMYLLRGRSGSLTAYHIKSVVESYVQSFIQKMET